MIAKIYELAMLVSNNTEYKAFVDYSGHVNRLEVRVIKDRDWTDQDYDYDFQKHICFNIGKNIEDEMLSIIEYLQSIRDEVCDD